MAKRKFFLKKRINISAFQVKDQNEIMIKLKFICFKKKHVFVINYNLKYIINLDLTEREITSFEEFSEHFQLAALKKVHAATNLNSNSSRSHSIFKLIFRFQKQTSKNINNLNTISFNNNNKPQQNNNNSYTNNRISNNHILSKSKSKENLFLNNFSTNNNYNPNNNLNNNYEEFSLTIVDLAGSERTAKSEVSGKNFGETCKINSSLTTLSRCFQIMKKNVNAISKQMIPYRESNLTKIFQENFLLDHSISMITTINPSLADFDDTLRILDFAGLTGKIITQKSRGILFDSNIKNRINNLYMLNGRLNPEFNTNPATKQFNISNIFNSTLSDFNENEPEKSKNNKCNISMNNEEVNKTSAAKGNYYII